MIIFMPLVVVWIGQLCVDVIGRQNMKVVVIGQLFCCYFLALFLLNNNNRFLKTHKTVVSMLFTIK